MNFPTGYSDIEKFDKDNNTVTKVLAVEVDDYSYYNEGNS